MHPIAHLTAASTRRPFVVLAIAIALSLVALLFVCVRFDISTDASELIARTEPWRMAEHRMDAAFPQNGDVIVVVIDAKTSELADAAAGALASRMTADHTHFRRVSRPDGGAFFAREGLLFGSRQDVAEATQAMVSAQPFLGPLATDPSLRGIATTIGTFVHGATTGQASLSQFEKPMTALATALEAQARGKPVFFSWQALLGRGGVLTAPKRQLVLATPLLDNSSMMPGAPASDAIRMIAAALKLDSAHGVTIRLTGSTPLSDEEFASLADHWWVVAGAMVAAMLLTLRLGTRSWRATGAILAVTLVGLDLTMALGLAAIGRLNIISIAFIPLFVGLGVDFGIQLAVRFQAERHAGLAPADAIIAAAGALGAQLMLAASAVCLGFLAFLPTAYVGVAQLGEIAAMGMVVALLLSVTLLPALLVLAPPLRSQTELGSPSLASMDRWLHRHRKQVLWAFMIATLASVVSLPFVRFDFNPLDLRAQDSEAMRALGELRDDPQRNPATIEILAPDLPQAQALADRLGRLPEVAQAATIASYVPEDQPDKLALIANAQALLSFSLDPFMPAEPASDAEQVEALRSTGKALAAAAAGGGAGSASAGRLAAAFTRLAAAQPRERAQASSALVPPLKTMLAQMRAALSAGPVTLAQLPADIKANWLAKDGRARISVAPHTNDNVSLRRFVTAVTALAPNATGPAVSMQGAAHTIAYAFVEAGVLALIAVSTLLLVMLRSVRETAFTLAPVVLAGFLTLGTCVVIGQPINFANIIAFPLLFGVGVAFHIYFVMAWRHGERDLLQTPLARAVFFSALATGMAFGSLWLSHHPGTASMGKILMISLAWTLVCALIFEPALLGIGTKQPQISDVIPDLVLISD